MVKSKNPAFDYIWNPVTGYLAGDPVNPQTAAIMKRFSGHKSLEYYIGTDLPCKRNSLHILGEAPRNFYSGRIPPFPFGCCPTLFRYRLPEPQLVDPDKRILVCTYGDLFAEYIPDGWIEEVFRAMARANTHRYFFQTSHTERLSASIRKSGGNGWKMHQHGIQYAIEVG